MLISEYKLWFTNEFQNFKGFNKKSDNACKFDNKMDNWIIMMMII